PREHKAKVVVWADLTVDDIDRLNESLNVDHNKQVLADIFRLDAWQKDLKQAIVMDMYYYSLQFARDNNFTREKTSAVFSIIKKTHEVAMETPFGNLEHTFKFFKELLLCHAVNRPPHSIELFSADEVRKITEYVINTYFRHFKMYKYAFTPLVRLDLTINYLGVPVSPEPTEAGDADEETTQDADTVTVDDAGEPAPLEGEAAEEQSSDTGENTAGNRSGEGNRPGENTAGNRSGEGNRPGENTAGNRSGEGNRPGENTAGNRSGEGNRPGETRQGIGQEKGIAQGKTRQGIGQEKGIAQGKTRQGIGQEKGIAQGKTRQGTEESEARKELRAMIQNYLTEEIKRVKVTVEEQLRTTEDTLAKKIDATEDKKKSPRKDSAKKKK
ncbi:hypothetical protein BaRGS_00023335, partial [Batillaria attramentaria]